MTEIGETAATVSSGGGDVNSSEEKEYDGREDNGSDNKTGERKSEAAEATAAAVVEWIAVTKILVGGSVRWRWRLQWKR